MIQNTGTARFIDFALHGGCSRKVGGLRLAELLRPLGIAEPWDDAETFDTGDTRLASSIDVVLPMIDDPALFGRIVVNHVLSDLYAVGARPLFGLNFIGIPPGSPAGDARIREMLASGQSALRDARVALTGGHSIESDELYYGMAVVGDVDGGGLFTGVPEHGDLVVLTKPLGTSVATVSWKTEGRAISDFQDVVDGMLTSNAKASSALAAAGAHACTDVTGFGLAGHLSNLLRRGGVGADVYLDELPVYESTLAVAAKSRGTRLLEANEDLLLGKVDDPESVLSLSTRLYLYDAQVSGGLLAAVRPSDEEALRREAKLLKQEMWIVGKVREGRSGHLRLLERKTDPEPGSRV